MSSPSGHTDARRPRSALIRGLRRLARRPGELVVDGVRYEPLTVERIERALARRGSKDYAVTFPGGRRMRIHCTRRRGYADLGSARGLDVLARIEDRIRPGDRLLLIPSGTGALCPRLSHLVGPSGALVALDDDRESVGYARLRYPLTNVSFEIGGIEALAGELDHAFDAVLAFDPVDDPDRAEYLAGELWRLVVPGGFLAAWAAGPDRHSGGDAPDAARTFLSALSRLAGGTEDAGSSAPAGSGSDDTPGRLVILSRNPG